MSFLLVLILDKPVDEADKAYYQRNKRNCVIGSINPFTVCFASPPLNVTSTEGM